MILLLSILGIFLPIILIYFNGKKYTSVYYLGGFYLLISLYGLVQIILLYSESVIFLSIVLVHFGFLYYLIGPMLYWYIRSIITDDHSLQKRDIIHFVPAVLWMASALHYIFSPFAYKVWAVTLFLADKSDPGMFDSAYLNSFIPLEIIFLSRPLLVLLYSIISAVRVVRFKMKSGSSRVFSSQQFMFRWLAVFFFLVIMLFSTHLLLMLDVLWKDDLGLYFNLNYLQLLSGAGLGCLVLSPFFFPAILYGLPRTPDLPANPVDGRQIHPGPVGEGKKVHVHLENGYLLQIGEKADSCMSVCQPYLHPEFSLANLAVMINVPVHHLAFYFREEKKHGFTEYRNHWRIEHAKNLIGDGKAQDLTLEAIGLMSGFSSRNTFLQAFKRAEGVSPREYAALIKQKSAEK
jgi:AraC-like DNA-binding protein